jgi:hypothetical protein
MTDNMHDSSSARLEESRANIRRLMRLELKRDPTDEELEERFLDIQAIKYGSALRRPAQSQPETLVVATPQKPYITPFLTLMIDAIEHFGITEHHWPKKEELAEYFRNSKLPGNVSISNSQANMMATFCRPLDAMEGGNTSLKPK